LITPSKSDGSSSIAAAEMVGVVVCAVMAGHARDDA
jgi:hypothetical protein